MKFFTLVPADTNINFIGKFKYFFTLSVVVLVIFLYGLFTKGLNYGVDFTGGTVLQVKFNQDTQIEEVRKLMTDIGHPDASVVGSGTAHQEYMITVRTLHQEKGAPSLSDTLLSKAGKDKVTIQSADIVGPKVGSELKTSALRALFYSIILITIYIWLRFDFKFAPGATVAMVHDLVMAAGFYLITGNEFTITAVAALLTIAGYSVNDTIVIYDRVREMYKMGGDDLPLPETINKAINITLSRTLLTSFIVLISIIPTIFLADGEIQNFAIAMAFGVFVGSYSTIYIASPLTIYVQRYFDKKEGRTRTRPQTA